MFEDIKHAIRKSAVYSLGNMSTKLIGLILIPLYTNQKYLTVADYGALGILEITSQVIIAVLSLAIASSFTRWFWDADYIKKQKSIFFTTLVVLTGVSLLALSATIPVSEGISRLIFGETSYAYVIVLVLITSVIQILILQIQTLQKLQSKALMYSLVNIVKLTISLLLTIYFIVYRGKKLDGIYEAQLIGSVITLLVLIPFTIRNCVARFETRILLEMLKFSYPLMLASISGVLFTVIDRYALNYIEGLDKVGVYNLGYKIASALKIIVVASVQLALSPILMKKINDPDNRRFYSKVMTYTGFVLMFCVIGLSLFSLEAIKVAAKDQIYWESANLVAILSFSFFFGMMKDNAIIGLHVVKKTKITGSLIVLASLINLGLNVLLIPRFSIYGASVATLISQILFFIMVYRSSQRLYPIPYEMRKLIQVVLAGTALIVAGFFVNPMNLGIRLVIKSLLLFSFPFILIPLRFYDRVELETIRKIFRNWKSISRLQSNLKRFFLRK
ncbi:MAG: polysaccharide biosynthesis C-terminal domain-containing protein [Bacteroidales bacterium]|nr:polysaccharide biosynthesis C-terminal domain-containing protein [Bacteroidales bacterium]